MPVTYTRYVDPSWEHADIPPSTWWTSTIFIAEASSYQRICIPCLHIERVHQVVRSMIIPHNMVQYVMKIAYSAPKYVPRRI